MEVWLIVLGAALSLTAVLYSSDCLIDNCILISERYHFPRFLIGALIVGVGTSSPEAFVSLFAALENQPNLSAGNALGSNIVNTSLLALVVLIYPTLSPTRSARISFSFLALLLLLIFFLIDDYTLVLSESLLLFSIAVIFIGLSIYRGYRNRRSFTPFAGHISHEHAFQNKISAPRLWLMSAVSFAILLISARYFVDLVLLFCRDLNVSDLVVGILVVAFGTSIPEFSASLQASRKKAYDISLGNMLGSMVFNLTIVFPFAGLSSEPVLEENFVDRDFYFLTLSTALCWIIYLLGRRAKLLRLVALITIVSYFSYCTVLVIGQIH